MVKIFFEKNLIGIKRLDGGEETIKPRVNKQKEREKEGFVSPSLASLPYLSRTNKFIKCFTRLGLFEGNVCIIRK